MTARDEHATGPLHAELTLTRVFDAPRELVFQVWTDSAHLARWWGPAMFTSPVCRVDARPGGELYIVMRSPQGDEYPMKGVFQEVVRPERLVFTSIALDGAGNVLLEGLNTITFEEQAGKTKLTMHTAMTGKTPAARGPLAGMGPGWQQTLDRLGVYLIKAA
jgi:uncharacterized protein YndB with AHSA1/START domain